MSTKSGEKAGLFGSSQSYGTRPSSRYAPRKLPLIAISSMPSNRGLLKQSSSLWYSGKYRHFASNHKEQHTPSSPSHDSSTSSPSPESSSSRNKRHIRWNERVLVRRFEKISPELIQHCYYSEEELSSFHREYALEEEDAASSVSSVWDTKEDDHEE
mmetsp:Transcript_3523/g.5618  ORF Transcript_3523/g.5618 Transcript_3523/m.5618 type:complete len:157 (+) Transcript_3523:357-827(+)|eukprot:CAMPEP_0178839252 /NCGR_PEP_ID=MMETSP0746-20121128/13765_1 /TAXON_ID=913974 /ORGANISM="Nitzschia punctata, Strain CCMP561" /LENGTH=156 /DNA_ID=CAMNT_0020502289 /DNA_START=530 /DNA_END=1000 /DNA_ORIENTATION=-